MTHRSQEFLSYSFAAGALQFGEFVLNSGRTSPYFLNTGAFSNGTHLNQLSGFYADTITRHCPAEFMLYGPAYKGIPLAAATAMSLHIQHNRTVPFAFDRKEAKDHGEGGLVVGAPLRDDVVIIEDVITSGISIDKAVSTILQHNAQAKAVVIALDRMEKSIESDRSAVQQVQDKHNIEVLSLARFSDLIEFVDNVTALHQFADVIRQYGDRYVIHS